MAGSSPRYASIGIIGGMGPEAGADLYRKIIRYFQKTRNSILDNEFPEILLHSIPAPAGVLDGSADQEVMGMLQNSLSLLEKSGCKLIVIACNSVQSLIPALQKSCAVPILRIADSSAEYCNERGFKRVALLSTQVTADSGAYDEVFAAHGITITNLEIAQQQEITNIIMHVLAGRHTQSDRNTLISISRNLIGEGAEAVLLSCTELPLVMNGYTADIPVIDCTEIYAQYAAKRSIAGA